MMLPGSAAEDSAAAVAVARLLFADLAAEVDDAYLANCADQAQDDVGLESALLAAAKRARAGAVGQAAFADLHEIAAERLQSVFVAAGQVAQWAGINLPAAEAFWAAGIDPAALSRHIVSRPELVAVPTPHGLSVEQWQQIFLLAARRADSPLALGAPLEMAAEVVNEFDRLDQVAGDVPCVRGGAAEPSWTLRLLPAGAQPPRLGCNYGGGGHPQLSEMLMLQLLRLEMGEAPVDQHSFTWLQGTLNGGKFAARHLFDSAARCVRVNTREIAVQAPHLGARLIQQAN